MDPEVIFNMKFPPEEGSEVMRMARAFFPFVVKCALDDDFEYGRAQHQPVTPNRITVTPYIDLGAKRMRLLLGSSVDLASSGRFQVSQHTVSPKLIEAERSATPGLINTDTDEVLIQNVAHYDTLIGAILVNYMREVTREQ
jgi:hypothetical protein